MSPTRDGYWGVCERCEHYRSEHADPFLGDKRNIGPCGVIVIDHAGEHLCDCPAFEES